MLKSLFPVTPAQVFSSGFCEIFKNIYFIEHLEKPVFSPYREIPIKKKLFFLNIFIDKYETLPRFQKKIVCFLSMFWFLPSNVKPPPKSAGGCFHWKLASTIENKCEQKQLIFLLFFFHVIKKVY